MTSDHAMKKGGVRYRYYVSCQDKEHLKLRRLRVPAGDLERLIIAQTHARRGPVPDQSMTRETVRDAVRRIIVASDEVRIDFGDGDDATIVIPVRFLSCNGERRIEAPDRIGLGRPDPALVKLIVRAHQARASLDTASSIEEAAARLGLTQAYYAVLLRLSFLAPDITAAFLDGNQPLALNRQRLARIGNLPLAWNEQRALLGFSSV